MSALIARHWPLTRLGSVVKFISGGTPNKGTESYWNGQIPWVTSGEMTSERIHNTEHALTEDGAFAGSRLVPKGTSFIVVRGMSLAKEFRVSLAMRDMAFNQDVKAVIPSDEFDPSFIYYYLKSQSNPIKDSASEAAHGTKKLDMAVLEQWPIPRVPLDVQKKIAAVLCHYDDLIENNKRRITILENMAEEIYREWFVRFRFPGWREAEFEKGSPKGWEYRKFRDLVTHYIGGGWGEDEQSAVFSEGAYVIRGTDIPKLTSGDFSPKIFRYHKPSNLKSRGMQEHDFAFEASGGSKDQLLGRNLMLTSGMLSVFGNDVMCASFCKHIRFDKEKVSPLFMKYFLKLFYEQDLVGIYQVQ